MDKQKILDLLLEQLEANLASLMSSAFAAKEAATGEESKAENKYDTRGLEASYLAGAQAKRTDEFQLAIHKLKKLNLRTYNETSKVDLTAVVTVEVNGEAKKHFFILPIAGGTKLLVDGQELNVITPDSLVGSALCGKIRNDVFEIKINNKSFEYEILNVY
ncbi:MAG: GreA/GreB family elongation factor [Bdellovibrionaceae bacterium]|nr:GreA/GreB family elongation factor [Pseudobdellovibrionaceae bacterium]